jgi:hypothetical protein
LAILPASQLDAREDRGQKPTSIVDHTPGELAIAPDGRRYAAVLGERGKGTPLTLVLRDLPSLRESGRLEVNGLDGAGFSPDGRWLALLVWRDRVIRPRPAWRPRSRLRGRPGGTTAGSSLPTGRLWPFTTGLGATSPGRETQIPPTGR